MIHQKNFPFHEPDEETDIIHVNHPRGRGGYGKVIIIVMVLVGLFFAVKSLYHLGKVQMQSGIPVIEASPDAYKTQPEDPGGMEIPHSDKEIYSHLKSPMDEAVNEPIDAYSAENSKPTIAELSAKNTPPDINHAGAVTSTQAKTIKLNKKGKEIDIAQSSPADDAPPKAKRIDVEKVLAKRTENEYWLQLGTFKSEEEATKAWQEMREKNSDILGALTIKVTKSDMKEQGVLYRLQAGSADDEEAAKSFCRKLNGRKQSCFYTIIKTQNNDL